MGITNSGRKFTILCGLNYTLSGLYPQTSLAWVTLSGESNLQPVQLYRSWRHANFSTRKLSLGIANLSLLGSAVWVTETKRHDMVGCLLSGLLRIFVAPLLTTFLRFRLASIFVKDFQTIKFYTSWMS